MTLFEPRTVSGTTPSAEPHSVTTAMLNTGIEVKQNVQDPNEAEPSMSGPTTVRRFFFLCPATPYRPPALYRPRRFSLLASI